jgi:hypothetical protein
MTIASSAVWSLTVAHGWSSTESLKTDMVSDVFDCVCEHHSNHPTQPAASSGWWRVSPCLAHGQMRTGEKREREKETLTLDVFLAL